MSHISYGLPFTSDESVVFCFYITSIPVFSAFNTKSQIAAYLKEVLAQPGVIRENLQFL